MSVVKEEKRFEKSLKKDFERKIKALQEKAEEFRAKGDLSRAEHCLFLARYLKDFLKEKRRKV
ncbi:MAG: hypothetical protein NZ932_04700 [Candidatus Bathyarchaeota archaeon]|nr:hypothetical protein [Candidatus Bathyarchaeota archaeon]